MRPLLAAFFLLLLIPAFSQVNFASLSFDEALKKARQEGKLLFVQFKAADCDQCNEVAEKGLNNAAVSAKTAKTFICLSIGKEHPDRNRIATTYGLSAVKAFGSLFLDDNATLLHSFLRTSSRPDDYLQQMDLAVSKAGEVLQISALEKELKNGNKSFGLIGLLLEKRKALNLPTDALLDDYVAALPADSLRSVTTLQFIAGMAPMLNSQADKALRADQALFNQMWYSMTLPVRAGINNRIIYKGMQKAIAEKNEELALQTARFAQGTNTNLTAATKAFDMNMLRYYDEVQDTAAYFRKAIAYYERYLLSVSPDSIKRIDSLNMAQLRDDSPKDTVRQGNRMQIRTMVQYAPVVQRFSSELNGGAYAFFKRTANPYLLSIATEWSKRALAFYESPEVLDTYAKLLYKQGQKKAAEEVMEKAISLHEKHGFPAERFKAVLEKMKRDVAATELE